MEIEDQDILAFVNTVKSLSEYDFTQYSDKSLKRRLSKILLDYNMTPDALHDKIKTDERFLEKIIREALRLLT